MTHGNTLVIGLGEVGGALAEVLERTAPVMRLDVTPRPIAQPIGVMHICFPFITAAAFARAVIGYMERFDPALTIINSTVAPGTTRAIAQVSSRAVVFSPVRGKHVRMRQDLLRYVKFVAACNATSACEAAEHFSQVGMKTRLLAQPETLELAKLAETSYFGVLIAFAQELSRYAIAAGADYGEVTSFFEEVEFLPRWPYFPGFIGGHCVIPNLELLAQMRSCPLFAAVIDSNERRAMELAPSTEEDREDK